MIALVFLLYFLLALTFTLAKAALAYVDPLFFITIRMISAGLLLIGYLYLFDRRQLRFDRSHGSLFLQIVLFHIYGAYVFEFFGLPHISSAKACLLYNLVPFITVFLAYRLMADRMTLKKWFGLCTGFIGFLILLLYGCESYDLFSFGCVSWPELSILASVISVAQGWLIMQKLVKQEGYSPLMVNGFGMTVGGILAGISSLLLEGNLTERIHESTMQFPLDQWVGMYIESPVGKVLFYSAILTVIANLICYNLYGHLLKLYSATFLSFAGIMSPLWAALYGCLLLNESLSPVFFIACAVIFTGLFIFYQEELRNFGTKKL